MNPASDRGIPQDLIEALRDAQRVVALTGSGISAESGVPTFREGQTGAVPPLCPNCGAPLRPDVVWFGETPPSAALEAASETARGCDLFLSIGTSSLVYPAAALPYEALENGAIIVEVSPAETSLTPHMDYAPRGGSARVLPELLRKALLPL